MNRSIRGSSPLRIIASRTQASDAWFSLQAVWRPQAIREARDPGSQVSTPHMANPSAIDCNESGSPVWANKCNARFIKCLSVPERVSRNDVALNDVS